MMTEYLVHVPIIKRFTLNESFSSVEHNQTDLYHIIGRSHTLLFHKISDNLVTLTWAKPINQKKHYNKKQMIDAYNRKMGRELVEGRREKLLAFISGNPQIPGKWSQKVDRKQLHSLIPTVVVESLKHYMSRSARALNLITPFQIIVYCPVKNKESKLALIDGSEFYEVDIAHGETKEND
jgi:hypothetical protein